MKITEVLEGLDKKMAEEMDSVKPVPLDLSNLRKFYSDETKKLNAIKASFEEKRARIDGALLMIEKRLEINNNAMKTLAEY